MNKCCDPCPWCGSKVEIEEFSWGIDWGWSHHCPDPECGWWDYMERDSVREEWFNEA